jgi:DNA-binding response OmpR family regulator
MKVLVVDDDPIARKVLDAFLKQSCCDVQMVEDSHRALCAMLAPDAPHIAIIDWMMPHLTGPELCAKLREHDFEIQPYLLMLSARKEKGDIAAALDAGADDFLTKPFNIMETQARLRVAEKSIQRQLVLRRRITELEQALEAQRSLIPPEPPTLPGKPEIRLDALKSEQLDTVLAAALRHSGQRDTPRHTSTPGSGSRIVAWTGLLAVRDEIWVDLMLEANPASMAALFEQAQGRKPASGELAEFIITVQTAIHEAMRSVLRASGQDVLTPLLPLVTTGADPFSRDVGMLVERHHYKVGAATLTLVAAAQACPLRHKAAERLRLFDVLARAYPPSDTHHVPLLHSGVVLNEHFIDKLKLFTQGSADVPPVLVYTPSSVALHYNRTGSPRTGRRAHA